MKISIVGAGAIGAHLGLALMANPHISVVMIGRATLLQEINVLGGAQITHLNGQKIFHPQSQLKIYDDISKINDSDVVIVLVKNHQTKSTAIQIKPYITPNTKVITLQNGTQNPEILEQILNVKVFTGSVPYNIRWISPATFHKGLDGDIVLDAALKPALETIMADAHLAIDWENNMTAILWGKLLINLNNAVNTLSGQPYTQQLMNRGYRRIYALALQEAIEVLKAQKIPFYVKAIPVVLLPWVLKLPNGLFKVVAKKMLQMDDGARASTWFDLNQNKPTEIDSLNGEIVRLAKELNRTAPINNQLVQWIKQAELAQQGSPNYTAEFMLKQLKA